MYHPLYKNTLANLLPFFSYTIPRTFALFINWLLGICVFWCVTIHKVSTLEINFSSWLKECLYPFLKMQGSKSAWTFDSLTSFPILRFFGNMSELHNAYFSKKCFQEIRFFLSKISFGGKTYKGFVQEDTTLPSSFTCFFRFVVPKLPSCIIKDIIFTWILQL